LQQEEAVGTSSRVDLSSVTRLPGDASADGSGAVGLERPFERDGFVAEIRPGRVTR
jgi:hypothetical protein